MTDPLTLGGLLSLLQQELARASSQTTPDGVELSMDVRHIDLELPARLHFQPVDSPDEPLGGRLLIALPSAREPAQPRALGRIHVTLNLRSEEPAQEPNHVRTALPRRRRP